MIESPQSFEPTESHTTLVCRLIGGPYDGEEILMAPGSYSHAPLQMIAQPHAHPEHGGCWACYECQEGMTDWPEDPSGRATCDYHFDGFRRPTCDFPS